MNELDVSIAGKGSVSSAGAGTQVQWENQAGAARRNWVYGQYDLPVYALNELPSVARIDSFLSTHPVDRAGLLALHAAEEAVADAGWHGKRFAIVVGCSRGPTVSWEAAFSQFRDEGEVTARTSPTTTLGSLAFTLADYFDSEGLATGMSVTCSSGMHAIVHGVALLQSGMVDRVLVGGTEAPLTAFTLAQMRALRVYASPGEKSMYACLPLAHPSTGMAIGEGAAFIAIERNDAGQAPLLKGLGFHREGGQSLTGISKAGHALQQAMKVASSDQRPDVVVVHAPGTRRGDAAEVTAISSLFANRLPYLTSLKWATGHTFGASGPLALVTAIGMLEHGEVLGIPGKPTYDGPPPKRMLINATGFGGNAVSLRIEAAK